MGLLDYLGSNGVLPAQPNNSSWDSTPGLPIGDILRRLFGGASPAGDTFDQRFGGMQPPAQQPQAPSPMQMQPPAQAQQAFNMPSGSYGMGGGNQPMQNIPVFGQPAQQFAQQPQGDTIAPPNAQQTSGFVAPPTAQLPEPTAGDRALGAFKGFAGGRGLLPAISGAVEGYRQGNVNDVERALISRGVDPATAKAAGTSPQLLQAILPRLFETKAPQFTQVGTTALGHPQYGFADANTQTVKVVNPSGTNGGGLAPGVDAMMQAGLRGEDFLKGVEADPAYGKGAANTVQMMVAGKLAPPSSFALAKPYWQSMIQLASQYDPGFDATLWASRNKARSEFNAGGPNSPAGMITAGNTAIQHLGALSDAADKLGNFSGIPFFNKTANELRNYIKGGSGNAQDIKAFEAIRNKYVEEATKFYRGTGGSEADIKRDLDTLSSAGSPKELRAAIGASAELMQSKINALQERWKQALGPGAGEFPIIHDKSAGELSKIRGRGEGAPEAGKASSGNGYRIIGVR